IGELADIPPDEDSLAGLGDDGNGLAHVTMHLRALHDQKQALRQAIDAYFAVDAHAALDRLRGHYLAGYATRQWWSQAITAMLRNVTKILSSAILYTHPRHAAAHEPVRDSEAKFSTIFQASPEPVAIVDWSDGTIVDANGAFERATGFPREEVLGRPFQA